MTSLRRHLFNDKAEQILTLLLEAGAEIDTVTDAPERETPLFPARQLIFEGDNFKQGGSAYLLIGGQFIPNCSNRLFRGGLQ